MSGLTIKVVRGDEMRRFTVPEATVESIRSACAERFSVPLTAMRIQYKDEDGDGIDVVCDEELQSAIAFSSGKVLRLFLTAKKTEGASVEKIAEDETAVNKEEEKLAKKQQKEREREQKEKGKLLKEEKKKALQKEMEEKALENIRKTISDSISKIAVSSAAESRQTPIQTQTVPPVKTHPPVQTHTQTIPPLKSQAQTKTPIRQAQSHTQTPAPQTQTNTTQAAVSEGHLQSLLSAALQSLQIPEQEAHEYLKSLTPEDIKAMPVETPIHHMLRHFFNHHFACAGMHPPPPPPPHMPPPPHHRHPHCQRHRGPDHMGPMSFLHSLANLAGQTVDFAGRTMFAGEHAPPPVPARVLLPGMNGPDVVALQRNLVFLGYMQVRPMFWDKRAGMYNDRTKQAVAKFQEDHGIVPIEGGVFDEETRDSMTSKVESVQEEREQARKAAAEVVEVTDTDGDVMRFCLSEDKKSVIEYVNGVEELSPVTWIEEDVVTGYIHDAKGRFKIREEGRVEKVAALKALMESVGITVKNRGTVIVDVDLDGDAETTEQQRVSAEEAIRKACESLGSAETADQVIAAFANMMSQAQANRPTTDQIRSFSMQTAAGLFNTVATAASTAASAASAASASSSTATASASAGVGGSATATAAASREEDEDADGFVAVSCQECTQMHECEGVTAGSVDQSEAPPVDDKEYKKQLEVLESMGFEIGDYIKHLIRSADGDVSKVVALLL